MSTTPAHAPLLSLTWTDHVTGRQGHLVVDRLVRGRLQRRTADARGLHAGRRWPAWPAA